MKRSLYLKLGLVSAAVVGGFAFWSSRQPAEVEVWMAAERARGEKFTLAEWGFDRPRQVTNRLAEVIDSSAGALKRLALHLTAGREVFPEAGPGTAFVRAKMPMLRSAADLQLDWGKASAELDRLEPVLRRLQDTLREPPRYSGLDYSALIAGNLQNFVAKRTVAQALFDAELLELHRGGLPEALGHLVALVRLTRACEEDDTLVSQMIRVAIAGLALEGVWQALQAPGWSEDQLAELQQELELLSLLPGLVRAHEFERALVLELLERTRKHGMSALSAAMGKPYAPEGAGNQIFFGLWRTLWSGSDQLLFLRFNQELLNAARALEKGERAQVALEASLAASGRLRDALRSPLSRRYWFSHTVSPNFSRAMQAVVRAETLRRLGIVAVACERHRLREGQYPDELRALEPAFLAAPVLDPFARQPFRYRLEGERFVLYSVGFDGNDDGGNVSPMVWVSAAWSPTGGPLLSWDACDVVWPTPAPW